MARNANLDAIQRDLAGLLLPEGFSATGRTFTRHVAPDLAHIVNIQAGERSLQGRFTVNLGIFLPECHRFYGGTPTASPQDVDCEVRARIGRLLAQPRDVWWPHTPLGASPLSEILSTVSVCALPFFRALPTREAIIASWRSGMLAPFMYPRQAISIAIVMAHLGSRTEATAVLSQVASSSLNRHLRAMATRALSALSLPIEPDRGA